MDLTQIKYFLALSRTLNFTRAAEACNVTQPALTRSIQRLEHEMGGALILRERGMTQLTELGRHILPTLRQAAEAAEAARMLATAHRRQDKTPLRLGLGADLDAGVMAPVLREVARRMPHLALTLRRGGTAEINEWLLGSEIDMGLTADVGGLTERANRWPLFDDAVVALVPPGHALAADGPIDSGLAAPHLLVGSIADDGPLARIRSRLARAEARHLGATPDQVGALVLAGLGLGLSTERHPPHPGLMRRPIVPPERLTVCLGAIPGRPHSQAAQAFLKLARARSWAAPPSISVAG